MSAVMIAGTVLEAIQVAQRMLDGALSISTLVANAQKEGRTQLTDAEWAQINQHSRNADDALENAINTRGNPIPKSSTSGFG